MCSFYKLASMKISLSNLPGSIFCYGVNMLNTETTFAGMVKPPMETIIGWKYGWVEARPLTGVDIFV